MKHLLSSLSLAVLLLINAPATQAQYMTAVGARAGKFASGLDVKRFFDTNGNTGLQVMGGWTKEANSGYMAKGFFIKQLPIFDSKLQIPVDMVFGVGTHVGYFRKNYYDVQEGDASYYRENTLSAGIDCSFGLEYDSNKWPITIGIDANPYYSLLKPGPEWLDLGFIVRVKF